MTTHPTPIKYAVYPGSVTLRDGTVATYTALELATLYGVQDEPYLTVSSPIMTPGGLAFFEYIHLKPRADGIYENIKLTAQDDDQVVTLDQDFDGDKAYTQETDPQNIDREQNLSDTESRRIF